MKILLVTGRLAEREVRRFASMSKRMVETIALPISVAAFITPRYAAERLGERNLVGFDLILLPGTVKGDVSPVEEATGIPTFKGPLHASELPYILDHLEKIKLSKTRPASELLLELLKRRAQEELREAEVEIIEAGEGILYLGRGKHRVAVGPGLPMRVVAEIVEAPILSLEEVKERAKYYMEEGADIIDIGMLAGRPMPERVETIVETIRGAVDLPISIDTLEVSEIEAAVDAGVDLILSVDAGNIEEAAPHLEETPTVVLPTNMREGLAPQSAIDKVRALRMNIRKARNLGITRIIADPILDPPIKPGLMESLMAYHIFRLSAPDVPILFGLGNAAELMDVDSPGVNGLLTSLAYEIGAGLLFVPEASPKTRGSVREVATASKMMFLAMRRGMNPKDLGIDLLILKEKRWKEEPYMVEIEREIRVIKAEREESYKINKAGWFRIQIDRRSGLIAAIHHSYRNGRADIIIKGSRGRDIYKAIIRMGLVTELEHAAYLGGELEKAEIALRLGRSYIQEAPLFQ